MVQSGLVTSSRQTVTSSKPCAMLVRVPQLSGLPRASLSRASIVNLPFLATSRRTIVAASNKQDEGAQPAAAPQAQAAVAVEEEESLYMEPLIRNFVLGASAGALAEMVHVLLTTAEVAEGAGGLFMLPAIIPLASEALAPLFLWDHVVALGVWAMLYLVEAKTLSNIISKHPLDPFSAAQEARTTMTLPKRMLPMSMVSAKRALFKLMSGMRRTPATANANTNAFTPVDFARELERRERANTPTAGGTTTIERPRVQDPTEPVEDTRTVPIPPKAPAAPVTRKATLKKGKKSGSGLRPVKLPSAPGKPSHDETLEKKRDKELRDRRAYLKNMWYGVAMSANLKADKPMEVKVMGRTVVLFRDETGTVKCMENLCSHRGAPLGQGWMKKVNGHNCVVCPYHAWAFDGEGRLKDVPTSIQGQLPKRPMQDTYPVEEKGGFIWLFFGSKSMPADERPPIPYIPELDDPKWRAVYGEMEFKAPHWSTYDNALDMAHIHYVHNGSFGNPNKPEIMDMNIERDTFGITGSFKIFNKPVNKLWEWTRVPHVPVELKAWVPMTSAVRITLGRGIQMITFVNTVPIDEHTSINKFCLIRNFATDPAMDGFVRDNMMTILTEDKVMVETVRPEDMAREFSLAADLPQIAFRQLRQEWVDMGYAVDPKDTVGPHGSLNL